MHRSATRHRHANPGLMMPVYERYALSGDWQLEDNASPVKRLGTVNAIATGDSLIVIGACQHRDNSQSLYSSAADGNSMRNPDASAIADTSRLLPGILAAGARSGSAFALSGTSVATPHVVTLDCRRNCQTRQPFRFRRSLVHSQFGNAE
jgi:hypothetical protein